MVRTCIWAWESGLSLRCAAELSPGQPRMVVPSSECWWDLQDLVRFVPGLGLCKGGVSLYIPSPKIEPH